MMGFYLYGFTTLGADPGPGIAGIRGDPVSSIPGHHLSLWVDFQEDAPPATLESVKAHHGVVRAAWASAPACVPARFGQWFPERDALERVVAGKASALERALEAVRGASEYGVRVLDPSLAEETEPSGAARPSSGRAYLEALRRKTSELEARAERARTLARDLESRMAGIVREQRFEPLRTRHGLVSMALLVPRELEGAYQERLAAFRTGNPGLSFLTTGPWPPYSFAP